MVMNEPSDTYYPLPTNGQWDRMRTPIEVIRVDRDEFINEIFVPNYDPEEGHIAFIGPTRCGKTTLAYQLLNKIASPELPAFVLVMKPKDDVVVDWSKLSGFKKTETWPPVWQRGWSNKSGGLGKKRRGWVFWPRHSLSDIKRDNKMLSVQFRRILNECYRKGQRIVFADEIVGLSKELNLEEELNAIWTRGGAMRCALWAASQRPFHAPLAMYSQSEHLFLFNDPDKRDRDRFREISGGIDPDLIDATVIALKKHECLYIGKTMAEDGISPALAIINAN